MSLIINYVICVICISKKLKYLKNEVKIRQLDFRAQFSFKFLGK